MIEKSKFNIIAWTVTGKECLKNFESDLSGLSAEEVKLRLSSFGTNQLAKDSSRSPLSLLLNQLKGFLNALLAGAAVIALSIGNYNDAIMIAAVVTFNTILGFIQEYRAEKTLAALKDMIPRKTMVRRSGQTYEIPAEEIVPGDIILLDAGSRVPADGRLVLTQSLEIDESVLTGESIPNLKKQDIQLELNTEISDRTNMAYMNTIVTRGRGEMLVTATGAATEIGKMAELLGTIGPTPTPLQLQLDNLGKKLAGFAIGIVSVIALFEYLRGDTLQQIAMSSISLAVAAMPEGLPAVVTITLALGLFRMSKKPFLEVS